jgi:glycosyltransferase involved in cell wall biosynthesis
VKIAFVLKYFLPEKTAGTEVYAAALCHELIKLNVEVLIIKPSVGLNDFYQYYHENIRVVEYPESDSIDKELQTGRRTPEGLNFFKTLLLSEKPDIVHFHEITGSNGITIHHLRSTKELRIPFFMTLHLIGYTCQTGMLKFKDRKECDGVVNTYRCSVCTLHKKGFVYGSAEILSLVGQWIQNNKINISALPAKLSGVMSYPLYMQNHFEGLKYIFSESEKVFLLSSWFKELLLANKFPKDKMVLLPKALPGETVHRKKQFRKRKENEAIKFVYLGRISRIKGLLILLKSLKIIQTSNWSLDIYGQITEDDYYIECNKIVQELNGSVNWKGIIRPSDVVNILQQYDALIFPTIIQEMVGLVVQEAFAAGIPVIGSNAKGIAEQVTDRVDGLLFKAGDVQSLKQILNEVISNVSLLPQLAANIKTPGLFNEVAAEALKIYASVFEAKNLAATPVR